MKPQGTQPEITLGRLLEIVDRRRRRFRQLQIIERQLKAPENKDLTEVLTNALKSADMLSSEETLGRILSDIRSEEYARFNSLREAIYNQHVSLDRIEIQTNDGPVTMVEQLDLNDN